jgi:serine/threonine-protein kinase
MSDQSITTACSGCGKNLRVGPHLAGKRVKCKACAAETSRPDHDVTQPTIVDRKPAASGNAASGNAASGNASSAPRSVGVTRQPEAAKSASVARSVTMGPAKPAAGGGKPAAPRRKVVAAKDLVPGAMMGQFRIVRVLGRGTSGAVYEAFDTVLERTVALKVLPESIAERGPTALADFLREANISSPLEHQNINSVFQAGRQGAVCFFVMEHSPDGSSADFVSGKGRMNPYDAARVAAAAARGLAAAHEGGILHGHIRPQNLLLGERFAVRVADFGLRAALERCGLVPDDAPAEFFSPELCAGQPTDVRSDLYCLGAVLHYLLTGRPPYEGPNRNAVMAGHMRLAPPDPRQVSEDIPDALASVVMRAMAKNPAGRYGSAAEMAADLEAVAAEAPVPEGEAAAKEPEAPRAAPPVQAPRAAVPWKWYAGIAAGVVLAFGLALWATVGGSKPAEEDPAAETPKKKADAGEVALRLIVNASGDADRVPNVPLVLDPAIAAHNKQVEGVLGEDLRNRKKFQPAPSGPPACPVCRKPAADEFTVPYNGRKVRFCSGKCAAEFRLNASAYSSKIPPDNPTD